MTNSIRGYPGSNLSVGPEMQQKTFPAPAFQPWLPMKRLSSLLVMTSGHTYTKLRGQSNECLYLIITGMVVGGLGRGSRISFILQTAYNNNNTKIFLLREVFSVCKIVSINIFSVLSLSVLSLLIMKVGAGDGKYFEEITNIDKKINTSRKCRNVEQLKIFFVRLTIPAGRT